ncbi:hypothetical protein [Goodfellowiella coeruleoviolacea]|uniref:Uncharacterized protein n=1 Tax=Goodfellowiella coeruleoviolacea TaxID=334858 RepID=A0AAE3KHV7_9PSEU|nr:hypothetical protein [Goodfellowiella coeruleoviolacea]MCP2168651.1 hypothetical protein [Goodfellowiella coeruleoviolacea]
MTENPTGPAAAELCAFCEVVPVAPICPHCGARNDAPPPRVAPWPPQTSPGPTGQQRPGH